MFVCNPINKHFVTQYYLVVLAEVFIFAFLLAVVFVFNFVLLILLLIKSRSSFYFQ